MKYAEQELEKGYYWTRWKCCKSWEPAEYVGAWFRFGLGSAAGTPEEIGPRIPHYEDTL